MQLNQKSFAGLRHAWVGLAVCCLALAGCRLPSGPAGLAAAADAFAPAPLALQDADRIMVLAPHPDDEALSAGGLLQEALARKLPVRVVF